MKLKALLLVACAMVGMSASALTNTAATDSLFISDFSATPGDTVTVPVRFKNATAYSALQVGVFVNGPLKFVPVSSMIIAGDTTNTWVEGVGRSVKYKAQGIDISYSTNLVSNDQELRVVGVQMSNKAVLEADPVGEPIFNCKIFVPGTTTLGDYTCDVKGWNDKKGVYQPIHYSTGKTDQSADGDGPDTKFTVHVVATAVNNVTTAKAVKSVKYYNVAGMESAEPFNGVNIVVTNYTDGTKSTSKVIK